MQQDNLLLATHLRGSNIWIILSEVNYNLCAKSGWNQARKSYEILRIFGAWDLEVISDQCTSNQIFFQEKEAFSGTKCEMWAYESVGFSDSNFSVQTDIKCGLEQQNFVRVSLDSGILENKGCTCHHMHLHANKICNKDKKTCFPGL